MNTLRWPWFALCYLTSLPVHYIWFFYDYLLKKKDKLTIIALPRTSPPPQPPTFCRRRHRDALSPLSPFSTLRYIDGWGSEIFYRWTNEGTKVFDVFHEKNWKKWSTREIRHCIHYQQVHAGYCWPFTSRLFLIFNFKITNLGIPGANTSEHHLLPSCTSSPAIQTSNCRLRILKFVALNTENTKAKKTKNPKPIVL